MRPSSMFVITIAVILAGPAAAQVGTPEGPNTAVPSVLAPRMPQSLPAPTPIVPDSGEPSVPPQSFTPTPTPVAPAPEQGTVTAVPLPPPGAPSRPAVTDSTVAGSPFVGAPISLAPPRPARPQPEPNPLSAKPAAAGAKLMVAPLASNNLPTPALSPEASPAEFLRAARGALAAGRNGEARSALEMAQTRLLHRVVDAGKEQEPSNDIAVKQISEAIGALASNDRMTCLRYIEFASQTLGSPLD
jgi:hypothetical protein